MDRILLITSFYSGLQDSIHSKNWNPKGMPAIYKLLEGFKKSNIKFDYCFIDDKTNSCEKYRNENFPETSFYILQLKKQILLKPFNLFNSYFYSKKKIEKIEEYIDLSKYNIIYIDRANIELIPYLKKNFKGKIFLRLHGVSTLYQSYKKSLKFKLYNYYKLYSLKHDINFILSSLDGTPVKEFLQNYTNINTKKKRIINGVNLIHGLDRKIEEKVRFLFVGRLENDKGVLEMINVFNSLASESLDKCTLKIVGGGSLLERVKEMSSMNDSIDVLSSVDHKRMEQIYLNSDVLISLNMLGNISNVVLEAINYELGIITLKEDKINNFDKESNEFLEDNVVYVERNKIENHLKEKILFFIQDINNIALYQQKVIDFLKPKLITWEDRIQMELDLLMELMEENKNELS